MSKLTKIRNYFDNNREVERFTKTLITALGVGFVNYLTQLYTIYPEYELTVTLLAIPLVDRVRAYIFRQLGLDN